MATVLHNEGIGCSKIALKSKFPMSTIQHIVKKWKKTESDANFHGRRHDRVIIKRMEHRIIGKILSTEGFRTRKLHLICNYGPTYKFPLRPSKSDWRKEVWRKPEEAYMSQGMRKTVKHAEGIVTVWASKGWNEVETLHFFESVMTNGGPKPGAQIIKRTIEHLWVELERRISSRKPKSKYELNAILSDSWENISPEVPINLVESMSRYIQTVTEAKGGCWNSAKYSPLFPNCPVVFNFEFPEFHALETPDINLHNTTIYEFHALETPDINPPETPMIQVRGINFEFPEFHALETPDINPPETPIYAEFHALETPDINPPETPINGSHKSAGIPPAPLNSNFFHALETPDIHPPDTPIYAGHKPAGIPPAPLNSNFVENFKLNGFLQFRTKGSSKLTVYTVITTLRKIQSCISIEFLKYGDNQSSPLRNNFQDVKIQTMFSSFPRVEGFRSLCGPTRRKSHFTPTRRHVGNPTDGDMKAAPQMNKFKALHFGDDWAKNLIIPQESGCGCVWAIGVDGSWAAGGQRRGGGRVDVHSGLGYLPIHITLTG
ncbi:Transposable element Tcb1 transposase [Folsomia candida]|uniref:Transposable element Tcb1 transposase n=1 Tax=Folsomia candida TaxID=158441 RepID=A0A226EAC7_FOLCA|nr:Transposable element Tcb1 transposase [Folsomia candida]